MFPITYTHSRPRRESAVPAKRADLAGEARINPWLLWRPERPQAAPVLTVAELAECRCPDICNRDHANE